MENCTNSSTDSLKNDLLIKSESEEKNDLPESPEYLIWKLNWVKKERKAFKKLLAKYTQNLSMKVLYLNFESEEQLSFDLEPLVKEAEADFIITSSGRCKIEIKDYKLVTSHECEEVPIKCEKKNFSEVF